MKYLKQLLIILAVSFIGEILKQIIPFPIPASIYGMALMLTALCAGVIKVPQVKEASTFLIEIMSVMFIPAGVGLMSSWGEIKSIAPALFFIITVTTTIVMIVSGIVTQKPSKEVKINERISIRIRFFRCIFIPAFV